jgi:hypothetical protein
MLNFLLEKMREDREIYCAQKALIFYELVQKKKNVSLIDMFNYNFFCKNTRKG